MKILHVNYHDIRGGAALAAFRLCRAQRERGLDARMLTVEKNGLGMWLVLLDENGNLAGSISRMPDLSQLEDYILRNGEKIVADAENIVLEIDLNETVEVDRRFEVRGKTVRRGHLAVELDI